jgi:glycosyltransferase involved in cell wall biosynthesis
MQVPIIVVIPCFKVENSIALVVKGIPKYVKTIILVDDKSTDKTLEVIRDLRSIDSRVFVVEHSENQGVGGAMLSGFQTALDFGAEIIVKMDGDNQMDPEYLPDLINPIIDGRCHFSKGNRFHDLRKLREMPFVRRVGNLGLSFLIKLASGYWSVFDPTNGYFAIKANTLRLIDLERLDKRYFFESSFLIELYYTGARIADIPIPARYGDEESNLSVFRTLVTFPFKLLKAFARRVLLRYFIYDFSIYSIYLLVGLPMLLFGVLFGLINWIHYDSLGKVTPTGTVMISVLSIVISIQLLLSVIHFDTNSILPYRGKN